MTLSCSRTPSRRVPGQRILFLRKIGGTTSVGKRVHREATGLELRELVCTFLAIIGAGCLFGGYRLFAAGVAPAALPAVFFAGFGAALIVLVAAMTVGPWRVRDVAVFPIHVRSLNIPPAAIERVSPPVTPPAPSGYRESHQFRPAN
jgi:hypothetical protein